MSGQVLFVPGRMLWQQKKFPAEKPGEAFDGRAAGESSLLRRNPGRSRTEFPEEIQGHDEPMA